MGVGPPGKQITPTANAREKSWGGQVSTPLGPDSWNAFMIDIVSFSLFILYYCCFSVFDWVTSVFVAVLLG